MDEDVRREMISLIPRLRRHARFMLNDADLADDFVQECLVRAVNKIETWQPGTNLQAWMTMILRNVIISHWRSMKRRPEIVELTVDDFAVRAGQELHLEMRELHRAIQQLSREHREVLFMCAVEGRQYEDAAALLGVPVGTVRSRLFRARTAIRQLLGEAPGEDKPEPNGSRVPLIGAVFAADSASPSRAASEARKPPKPPRDVQFETDIETMRRHIREGEVRVEQQREMVLQLREQGADSKLAESLLSSYEDLLAQSRVLLDRLQAKDTQASS